jgi:hypothetical protein
VGRIIKNALAIGGVITLTYIFVTFTSGVYLHNRLNGTWVSVERSSDTYTFTAGQYTHNGAVTGTYRIRANRIIFDNGDEFYIWITKKYMTLDGVYYLKRLT